MLRNKPPNKARIFYDPFCGKVKIEVEFVKARRDLTHMGIGMVGRELVQVQQGLVHILLQQQGCLQSI